MRLITVGFVALLCGCGSSPTPPPPQDLSPPPDLTSSSLPKLTVNNTLGWCKVTVTVSGTPTVFDNASHAFDVASGTTVMLHAEPHPGFIQVKWTGTSTMNGADATYAVTGAATQTVTACCPFPDGTGC